MHHLKIDESLIMNQFKLHLSIVGMLLSGMFLQAQIKPAGTWTAYLNHSRGVQSAIKNHVYYTLTSGGMYSYEPETEETRTFSTIEGLSNINPTTIFHAEKAGLVFIGYEDGMVDYFSEPEQIQYFTEIQRNTFYTQKRINDFASQGDLLFIATDFGIVIYDLETRLPVTDVTQFGENPTRLPVSSVAIFNDMIYVLIKNVGIYSAPIDFPNLKDPGIWASEEFSTGFPTGSKAYELGANSQGLYFRSDTTVFFTDGSEWTPYDNLDGNWTRLYVWEDAVAGSRGNTIRVFYNDGDKLSFNIIGPINDIEYIDRDIFYVTTGFLGGKLYNKGSTKDIVPDGPASNDCVRLGTGNGEVYVAPIGYDQAFGPVTSSLGVFYYTAENGWSRLDSSSKQLDPSVSTGFARMHYDDETRIAYAGSWGSGMVTFKDGVMQEFFNCQNAGISIINNTCDLSNRGNTRVSGMDVDQFGNTWISIDFARDPLMVRSAEDGQWYAANSLLIPGNDHFVGMVADEYGSKWILNAEQGVLVYNDNNTPLDFSDDRVVTLRSGLNQGNLPSNEVYSIAVDHDGFVWVGTGQGVVFYDPFSIAQGNITDAFTPAYERRPLLKDAIINAIAVDGGNRKWMATNDGVFLVSEDGDDVIHAFTTENSPLLSNSVNDVSVDNITGEVFFATSRGLISFQSDATTGANNCNEVFVFPNPYFTDSQGNITIRGSGAESTVKITTISGMLVKELESQGGTTLWDGRDVYGNQVRSGVYLALIADRDGENACIGKFTVIAR